MRTDRGGVQQSIRCVSSYAEPGGRSGRRPSDRADTRRAFGPCACGSDASARLSGQISSCSPPMDSGKAFPLVIRQQWWCTNREIRKRAPCFCGRTIGLTCVGPEVSLEVWALGVGLAAAGVFAAVDGGPLFPCRPSTTLHLHPTRGQLLSG